MPLKIIKRSTLERFIECNESKLGFMYERTYVSIKRFRSMLHSAGHFLSPTRTITDDRAAYIVWTGVLRGTLSVIRYFRKTDHLVTLDYVRGLGWGWWIGFGNNPRKPKRYNVRSIIRRESRPCQFDKESIDISPRCVGVVALINRFEQQDATLENTLLWYFYAYEIDRDRSLRCWILFFFFSSRK